MTDISVTLVEQPIEVEMVGGIGPQGLPGVNGGIGSSAGNAALFVAAPGMAIGVGITHFQTAGYAEVGVGGAEYVYDAAVDAAYVTANPSRSFLAADGRGFRLSLDQVITPYMVGAEFYAPATSYIGQDTRPTSGIPDSGAALRVFWGMVSDIRNTGVCFDRSGFFGTTLSLQVGGTTVDNAGYSAKASVTGLMTLVALSEVGGPVIEFRNMAGADWTGGIKIIAGGSSTTYASKHHCGVKFSGRMAPCTLGSIETHGFVFGCVNVTKAGVSPSHVGEWINIRTLYAQDCGSGVIPATANSGLTSTFTTGTTTGSDFNVDQFTELTGLGTNLPSWVDDIGSIYEHNVGVTIDGRMYQVASINRGASSLKIKPQIADGVASGTLTYWFGGAWVEGGADGSLGQIGVLTTTRCGIGFNTAAIYVSDVIRHTSQHDGTPFMFGRIDPGTPPNPSVAGRQFGGGILSGLYIEEGGSTFDGVLFNTGASYSSYRIGWWDMITKSKLAVPAPWDGTMANDLLGGFGLQNIQAGDNVWESRSKSYIMSGVFGTDNFKIAANRKAAATYDPVDNATIFLEEYDPEDDRLFGVRSRILIVCGTGSNKQPTGTITLNAAFFGNLIDGAGTKVYSGLARPLFLLITADPENGNFTSRELNKPFAAGAAVADATDAASAITQLNTLLARARDAGLIAP